MAAVIWKVKRQTFSKTKSTIKINFIQGRFEAGFLRIFVPIISRTFFVIFCDTFWLFYSGLYLLLPTTTLGRPARPSSWQETLRGHVLIAADVVKYVCRRPLAGSASAPSTPGVCVGGGTQGPEKKYSGNGRKRPEMQ